MRGLLNRGQVLLAVFRIKVGFSLGCKFRAGRVMSLLAGGRLPLPFFPQNSRERACFSENQYVKELVRSQS